VDAEGKPAFPNAGYVMMEAEWNFWTADRVDLDAMQVPEEIKSTLILGTVRRCLPPLKPQIELLHGEREIAPGIWSVPAPGHTPGHMAVCISSGHASALHIADAVLHPLHLEHPSWRNVFDLAQEQAAETRSKILGRAAAVRTNVLAYHFPFPTLGQIVSRGGAWAWEPIP
jgi:glyoxylase-like metal-dependent hydrolase (beta-lactamase superfamily II)